MNPVSIELRHIVPKLPRKKRPSLVLSAREREVLSLYLDGRRPKEIAEQLVISIKTVSSHKANIMRKLGAVNDVELVKCAIRAGFTIA